jgi:hypothetical protein
MMLSRHGFSAESAKRRTAQGLLGNHQVPSTEHTTNSKDTGAMLAIYAV